MLFKSFQIVKVFGREFVDSTQMANAEVADNYFAHKTLSLNSNAGFKNVYKYVKVSVLITLVKKVVSSVG